MFARAGVRAPRFMLIAATFFTFLSAAAAAQTSSPPAVAEPSTSSTPTICGMSIPKPAALPPASSGPVVLAIVPCFERQGGASMIDPQTYLYYIRLRPSLPSQGVWVAYDEAARTQMLADFRALWATSFLDDLRVEVIDYLLPNGVVGKLVKYRPRRATADQDRRIHRHESARVDEDRREAQRRERDAAARLVHRRSRRASRRHDHPRDAVGEGLPRQHGHARDHPDCRRTEARRT